MATTFSLSFSLDHSKPHHLHLSSNTHFKSHLHTPFLNPKSPPPFLIFPKFERFSVIFSSSSSSQSSSSSTLLDPLRTGRFLSKEELEKLQLLQDYKYFQELESGSMLIRVMREDETDMIVGLLSESFAESMLMPMGYVTLLGILVKQYLIERRALMPHTATLIGYYQGDNEEAEVQLAGTVEVSFDKMGANASPPTPTPPKGSPYICNMTVKKTLRRRGIGWHLLKASEELISQMSSSSTSREEVFLHCRVIDEAPFSMYTKAGYEVVKTDSFLILLTLQRRKHLMRKQLLFPPPLINNPSSEQTDGSTFSNDENPS
ncbi:hypothetical protein LguiA_032723 [Lonicera macranthoides]